MTRTSAALLVVLSLHGAKSLLLRVPSFRPVQPSYAPGTQTARTRCVLGDAAAEASGQPSNSPQMEADSGEEVDPIERDELWLDADSVRYGDASRGAGTGYCASFRPFDLAGNHSRAVLVLHLPEADEGVGGVDDAIGSACALTERLALACECVALVPLLRGGPWAPERLAGEVWSACSYLNTQRKAEALAIVAVGEAARIVVSLLAEDVLSAHAMVLLCPEHGGSAASAANTGRAARDLSVPLLAVCTGADGATHAAALQEALALNPRVGGDYYVAEFAEAGHAFILRPRSPADASAAERALALAQSWIDTYCPERLG